MHGDLTTARPAGLYGSSLPSYTPPLPGLTGGGTIPAQVLLGVLTQESNLEQASTHVIQGQTSNPLTAFNWFGNWVNGVEGNTVNWSQSDCGYGIGQVTTGMCLTVGQNGDKGCTYDPLVSPRTQRGGLRSPSTTRPTSPRPPGYWPTPGTSSPPTTCP